MDLKSIPDIHKYPALAKQLRREQQDARLRADPTAPPIVRPAYASFRTMHELFKQTRAEQKMSLAVLAKSVGVTPRFIAKMEEGSPIPMNKIVPLAEALGLTIMPEFHHCLARRLQRELFNREKEPDKIVDAVKTILRYRK